MGERKVKLSYREREMILCYLRWYSVEQISEVLQTPMIYVRSVYLDYINLSSKYKKQVYKKYKEDKIFKTCLRKLIDKDKNRYYSK